MSDMQPVPSLSRFSLSFQEEGRPWERGWLKHLSPLTYPLSFVALP